MAGIGFELKKILKEDSIFSIVKVYGYSAMLSAGPWIISILTIIAIGLVNIYNYNNPGQTSQFQVIVTYSNAIAASLLITGFLQLPFTRYVADRIFDKEEHLVMSIFFGMLVINIIIGFLLIIPYVNYLFYSQTLLFVILAISTFMIMSCIWIANILAQSLKKYKLVLLFYLIAYLIIYLFAYFFGDTIENLIFAFFFGNTILFIGLFFLIIRAYPSKIPITFKFLYDGKFYWSLGFAGLFFNMGVWADKFIFWFHPVTSYRVIDNLKASLVYDMPIFLAYLSIIPGMAIFFYRLEVDFAEKYDQFFNSVREGGTLSIIKHYKGLMIFSIRSALREIIIIQGIITITLLITSEYIFDMFKIPILYKNLFNVDIIGVQLQLGFMSMLAVLHYINKRMETVWLSLLFLVLNIVLTLISIELGPKFFGYGFAIAGLISFIASIVVIRKALEELDYETFMSI